MSQEKGIRGMTRHSWTPPRASKKEAEPTREEKLAQARLILKENVQRSMQLQMAIRDRKGGREPPLAARIDLIVLAELRAYTIRRDELSIRYEKDYAAWTRKHAEEREALEARATRAVHERDEINWSRKPTKAEWVRCPHMQWVPPGPVMAEKEEEEGEIVSSNEREKERGTTKTSRTATSKLRAGIARINQRIQEGFRHRDVRTGGPLPPTPPTPPPSPPRRRECGLCLAHQRRQLRVRQEAELEDLYAGYCERTYRAFEETAAKVGPRHLAWWPPSDKPVRPGPGTSKTMSPGGPIMISSRALNAPRRAIWMGDFACENSGGGSSSGGGGGGDIQGSLRYIQEQW
ncbi:hypothetical protein F4809DRAFT_638535 [Biscogniauxia mediterranea]|nr:hypothetical protein F4809DRAFT_638535 [Biscogniauxia mediterranea]